MLHFEIILPSGTDPVDIDCRVGEIFYSEGLQISLKSTLRAYPGCIHWHWKKGAGKGILEVTHWPQNSRLWISAHSNRTADWIDELLPRLVERLQTNFL